MGKPEKKLKRMFMILGITAAVYGAFRYLLPLVIPFLVSWGFAVLLRPSAQWISEHCPLFRLPIGAVGAIELVLLLMLFAAGIYGGGRVFLAEAQLLTQQIPMWIEELDMWLTGICHRLELGMCLQTDLLVLLMREMLREVLIGVKDAAMPYLMTNSVSVFRWGIGAAVMTVLVFISTGLMLQELPMWEKCCRRSYFAEEMNLIGQRLSLVMRAFVKTQLVILLLTIMICTAGFYLMKNPYYILAGTAVGIMDALPILGTGTVLIPWAVLSFFRKQWMRAVLLLGIYLLCYVIREYLEAKMMGQQVGLSPLQNLIAIYVGLKLFGIVGVVLGPIGLLLIGDLAEAWSDSP